MSGNGPSVAVVVGATGAIGRGIVSDVAGEGLAVVAVARDSAALNALSDEVRGVEPCVADIADDDSIVAIEKAVGDRPVAVAVHAAASPAGTDVTTVPTSTIVEGIEVKVAGLLRLLRAVDSVIETGGCLIALGGTLGAEPSPALPVSGVANAAQANLVRQLAKALGPRQVSVHQVAPGPVDTDRLRGLVSVEAQRRGMTVEQILEERRAAIPARRLVAVADVVWAVRMLRSPHAAMLTGGTTTVDGGRRHAIM